MEKYLMKMVEDSDRAVVLYHRSDAKTIYANKLALSLYGDGSGGINIEEFFTKADSNPIIFRTAKETLEEKGEAYVYDFMTRTVWGEEQLTDIHIGYADEEKLQIYLKIELKEDNRMERVKQLLERSHRAEAILFFDEDFSLVYSNQSLYQLFSAKKEKEEFISLAQMFPSEKRERYLDELKTELKQSIAYYTEMEIIDFSGQVKEVALDFQHMKLGGDGMKLVVFINPLEERIKRAGKFLKFNSLANYFKGIQALSGESLFLVDLKENILIHRGREELRLPTHVHNYPDAVIPLFHPEDVAGFLQYTNRCRKGGDGTFRGRLKSSKGDYRLYEMFSIAFLDDDGEPVEILGKIKRIEEENES